MISRIFVKVKDIFKYFSYRRQSVFVSPSAIVRNCQFESPLGYNRVGQKSLLINCTIGKGTYFQNNCSYVKTKVGRYCSIASNSMIIVGEHPTTKYVALHPSFYSGRAIAGLSFEHKSFENEYKQLPDGFYCSIGNDVWIGTGAMIYGGVTVNDGAIVAAGAIVTKDVPPYSIVAGVPAKVIKYRFNEKQISILKQFKWWDKDEQWIKEHLDLFDDVDNLINFIENIG